MTISDLPGASHLSTRHQPGHTCKHWSDQKRDGRPPVRTISINKRIDLLDPRRPRCGIIFGRTTFYGLTYHKIIYYRRISRGMLSHGTSSCRMLCLSIFR